MRPENSPAAAAADQDTIFALSSGQPPAGIAVIRISGPSAHDALECLAPGTVLAPRVATLRTLIDPLDEAPLDRALVLWFPGPSTVTGEDLAEFHVHGGRAIVAAIFATLGRLPGFRPALAGEFTRRAFAHGRIDLVEAEALGDLLAAETEGQRRSAMILADGRLSRAIEAWQRSILALSAQVEALIDFSDEEDVDADITNIRAKAGMLVGEIDLWLALPQAERLRDGVRVVLAGPPNAGKSTLLNALAGRDAAIVTPIAGTTRDLIEIPIALGGVAFVMTDTAGLRDAGDDLVEAIGVERANKAIIGADILLWLGEPDACPMHPRALRVGAQADRIDRDVSAYDLLLSAITGQGLDDLQQRMVKIAASLLPGEGEAALNLRLRNGLADVRRSLTDVAVTVDLVLVAESFRAARAALDGLTGKAGAEDMFDALFGAFCIGK